MSDDATRYMALLHELFDALPRQAPGSTAETLAALAAVPGLPAAPRIVDFGCGRGASALPLAEVTGGLVVGCDRHRPALALLRAAAIASGLGDRIDVVCADMAQPPFAPGTFDLIWSEGAVYAVGFAEGLAAWRPLLRPGGALVVSELVWLTDRPDAATRAFFSTEYPDMADLDTRRGQLVAAGYRLLADFLLSATGWQDYYAGLEPRLSPLVRDHPDDPVAARLAADITAEINHYRRAGDQYGYAMFIAEAG